MAKSRQIEFNIGEEIFGFKNEEIKDEKSIQQSKHRCEMDKCEGDSASSTMVRSFEVWKAKSPET